MEGGTGRTPKGLSDHLGAHGSGLRTGQMIRINDDLRVQIDAFRSSPPLPPPQTGA
jgi:hypothetical protein